MRILFIQTGDYGEAWQRFRAGGNENFRDQRRSVDFVESLSVEHDVTVMARCARLHDEQLQPRLRSLGVSPGVFYGRRPMNELLSQLAPDAIVLSSPNWIAVAWAARRGTALLPIFADMFTRGGLKNRYRNWRLGRTLRRSGAPCYGNHSLEASKSMLLLGLPPERIVPWEMKPMVADAEPKTAPGNNVLRILFAGQLLHAKGVGDCIDAIAILRRDGVPATFTAFGPGDRQPFVSQAAQLGIADAVALPGLVSTAEIRTAMRQHDAIVVPSRHDYPEGLPNTIFEALASRTPLVASDHPAFAPRLSRDRDALIFRAADPADLARQLRRLISEPTLYGILSRNSAAALASLDVGMDGQELIRTFLGDLHNRTGWVERHSLAKVSAARRA